MRRGSVVIEMIGEDIISGKGMDDFKLPYNLGVVFDGGGSWNSALSISDRAYRKEYGTTALAFGCINCKELVVVDDWGKPTKFGFTRIDEFERQVVHLIEERLWLGYI